MFYTWEIQETVFINVGHVKFIMQHFFLTVKKWRSLTFMSFIKKNK